MHPSLKKFKENDVLTPYLFEVVNHRLDFLPENLHQILLKEAALLSSWEVRSLQDHQVALRLKGYLRNKNLSKMGYPVRPTGSHLQTPRDVSKWIQTTKIIYQKVYEGLTFNQALEIATNDWDTMEQYDFKNWLKFYQDNGHKKYAQTQPGYLQLHGDGAPMVPWAHLRGKLPQGIPNVPDIDELAAEDEMKQAQKEAEQEREEQLKKKIRSLDSRLRSALKLMSDPAVQRELAKSMDISVGEWVKQLQDLQRYILLTPLKNASSLDDIVHQRANILLSWGYPQASQALVALAQAADPPPVGDLEEELAGTAPDDLEGEPEQPEEEEELQMTDPVMEEPDDTAMEEVARRMNPGDHGASDDSFFADDDLVVVEAQVAPPQMSAPVEEGPIEVTEEDMEMPQRNIPQGAMTGDAASDILDHVTIDDVVDRMETVSNILKNREIPRQLAIIDLMMDKLGIASYFPQLGEATKSALESNQYMSTRIEDILGKLRGSMEPEIQIDLTSTPEDEGHMDETLQEVRRNLEEKERSSRMKEENRAKTQAPAEAIPELAGPVEVEQATPTRIAPPV